jgi:hypothetical protein
MRQESKEFCSSDGLLFNPFPGSSCVHWIVTVGIEPQTMAKACFYRGIRVRGFLRFRLLSFALRDLIRSLQRTKSAPEIGCLLPRLRHMLLKTLPQPRSITSWGCAEESRIFAVELRRALIANCIGSVRDGVTAECQELSRLK